MRRARQRLLPAGITIGVLWGLSIGLAAAVAQTVRTPASAAAARGATTFRDHCAVCHGERGKGNGPAAAALTPRPTNLARLTTRTGPFPAAHVTAVIKGVDPVVAHGIPAMMVWGALFLADANGNQEVADARIRDLVQFIESIQDVKSSHSS